MLVAETSHFATGAAEGGWGGGGAGATVCLLVQLRPRRAFVIAFAVVTVLAVVLATAFAFCHCIGLAFGHRPRLGVCLPWPCPFGVTMVVTMLFTWAGVLPLPLAGVACSGGCLGGGLHGLETSRVWRLPVCRI